MNEGAQVFGIKVNEAVAIYLACITVLGMMGDEEIKHDGKDELEDATVRWHRFCIARGIRVPAPKEALAAMKSSAQVKVL